MGITRTQIDRISVGGLLILGFGTIMIVLAVVVAVSAWQYRELQQKDEDLDLITDIAFALDDARFDVALSTLLLERYVISGSDILIPEIRLNAGEAESAITRVLDLEVAQAFDFGVESDEEELAELEAIRAETADFTATVEEVIALRQSSDTEAARTALESAAPQITLLGTRLADATLDKREELLPLQNKLETSRDVAFWLLLALGAGGAVIGLAATFVITRSIVKPLSSLKSAALAIADGNLNVRAQPRGPTELAQLGASISQMTDSLIKDRETITHLAYHDALTNLPNRTLLEDRAGVAFAQARRGGHSTAIVSLDIDRLKMVNDTLGHPAGDELLKAAAIRLGGLIRQGDTLARIGGDEFVAILSHCRTASDGVNAAIRMVEAFKTPFEVDGEHVRATVSAGISFFPGDGDSLKSLVKKADAAMYRAKRSGGRGYRVYDGSMNARASERMEIERGLYHALERDELTVHYQPQVSPHTGSVAGVEALIRWQHPERGLVPPDEFIPVAEESSLIITIGEWVLREACRQVGQWQSQGLPHLRLAVNVSTRQFQRSDFVKTVRCSLEETGFDPRLLELEVTESLIIEDTEGARASLEELSAMGIRIAIDDFGTGYSSLQHLRTLPIDVLKIDRSFVSNLTTNANDTAIALSVISLAHSLNFTVVAEGVETPEQLAFLREHQSDLYQGFLHSRPLPADQIHTLLKGVPEATAASAPSPDRA